MKKLTDRELDAIFGAVESRARYLDAIISDDGEEDGRRESACEELDALKAAAKKIGVWDD